MTSNLMFIDIILIKSDALNRMLLYIGVQSKLLDYKLLEKWHVGCASLAFFCLASCLRGRLSSRLAILSSSVKSLLLFRWELWRSALPQQPLSSMLFSFCMCGRHSQRHCSSFPSHILLAIGPPWSVSVGWWDFSFKNSKGTLNFKRSRSLLLMNDGHIMLTTLNRLLGSPLLLCICRRQIRRESAILTHDNGGYGNLHPRDRTIKSKRGGRREGVVHP
jgi:hypothetical protein